MLRINRETDYGVLILSAMALAPQQRVSSVQLAQTHGLPQPVVSKVMKQLVHAGLLCSFRGARGGYGLARSPHKISIAEVIEALEGPIAITECVEKGVTSCRHVHDCNAGAAWSRISAVVRRALERVTLAQMAASPQQPAMLPGAGLLSTGIDYGIAEE